MWPFIEIKPGEIVLDSSERVLKKAQYQNWLSASGLLKAAEEEALKITAAAHAAFEQQKTLGWQAGVEEARVQQAIMVQKTLHQCQQYYSQVGHQLAQVVMQALRKIVHDYDNTELTLNTVRQALSLVSHQKQVMLYVQPEQASFVREQVARIMQADPQMDYVEVFADPSMGRGGCRLETEVAVIDASIEGQLAALASALTASDVNSGSPAAKVSDESAASAGTSDTLIGAAC